MRTLLHVLVALVACTSVGHAQWERTGGPEGHEIQCLEVVDGRLLAGTSTDGLHVSMDAGESWSPLNVGLEFADVRCVVEVAGALLAATSDGVYRSTDDGQTWDPPSATGGFASRDLAVFDGDVFAAATGVYRSSDGGITWELTDLFQGFFHSIAATESVILAGSSSDLHRSTDGGDTWDRLEEFGAHVHFSIVADGQTVLVGRNREVLRSDDGGLTLDRIEVPFDVSVANLYDFAILDGTYYAGTSYDGVYRSTDLGQTWEPASVGMGPKEIQALAAIDGTLVAGAVYSGLYRSTDGAQTWQKANQGMPPGGAIETIVRDGTTIYAGTRDGVYRTDDHGASWTKVTGNDAVDQGVIAAMTVHDGTLFVTSRQRYETSIYRRDGSTWTEVANGLPSDLVFVFGLDSSGPNLVAGTEYGIYLSSDDGESWSPTNGVGGVDDVAVAGDGRVFAIFRNDGVYRSVNDGATWHRVLGITDLTSVSASGNFAYVSQFGGGVWISSDGGSSWGFVNFGVSVFDVQVVGDGRVLAATAFPDNRIYQSTDFGQTFFSSSGGLSPSAIALHFGRNDTYDFVGMGHSGVWRRIRPDAVAVDPPSVPGAGALLAARPNPFRSQASIRFAVPEAGDARVTVHDVAGKRVATLVDGVRTAGSHEVTFDASTLPAGVYFFRLEAGTHTDVKRMVRVE